jgi:hypothetical protein
VRKIQKNAVTLLGIIALVAVLTSWILDLGLDLVPVGHLPVVYDLSLAFLTGWFFHILVVVIPERQREARLIQTLRGALMQIANNGNDLIRDFEFIGKCPERNIDSEHIHKVCRTIGRYGGEQFMVSRMSVARGAFLRIEPFLTLLPVDLTVALQHVDQLFVHDQLDVPRELTYDKSASALQPDNIRNSGVMWLKVDGVRVPKRYTMIGWERVVLDYYNKTEAVRSAIPARYLKEKGDQSERVEFWGLHKLNTPDLPYTEYPSTAFSDDWVGPIPKESKYGFEG